jgi:hypothetical protein
MNVVAAEGLYPQRGCRLAGRLVLACCCKDTWRCGGDLQREDDHLLGSRSRLDCVLWIPQVGSIEAQRLDQASMVGQPCSQARSDCQGAVIQLQAPHCLLQGPPACAAQLQEPGRR